MNCLSNVYLYFELQCSSHFYNRKSEIRFIIFKKMKLPDTLQYIEEKILEKIYF